MKTLKIDLTFSCKEDVLNMPQTKFGVYCGACKKEGRL